MDESTERLLSQLAKDQVTLGTEMAKQVQALEQRNAELQAQVEVLRTALQNQLNDCINFDGGWLTDLIMEHSSKILKSTPAQCLAERDAAVSKVAIHWALGAYGNQDIDYQDIQKAGEDYANQIRQQAKAGE